MRNHFAETLYQLGKENPNIFIVVSDISPAGSMEKFRQEFPDRFINVGVAEQSMIGICAGLALRGCIPFAYTIATFTIYRPFEMIRDDVCYQNLPVTMVGMGSGIVYSTLGGTHHTQEDIAVMSALPNMSVIAPCDPLEIVPAMHYACEGHGPLYLRLGKAGEPIFTKDSPEPFVFGRIRKIKEGSDVCILSYGPIMSMASEIAQELEGCGRKTALYSVHTLKPLDREGIADVLDKYETVIVLEEHSEIGGLAANVKQIAWDSRAVCALHTHSLEDKFIHHYGSHESLQREHKLAPDLILNQVLRR